MTVSGTVAVPRTFDACDCSLDDERCTEPNELRGLDPPILRGKQEFRPVDGHGIVGPEQGSVLCSG